MGTFSGVSKYEKTKTQETDTLIPNRNSRFQQVFQMNISNLVSLFSFLKADRDQNNGSKKLALMELQFIKKSNLAKHRKIGLARHWLPINREGCCTVLVKYQPIARDASELPPTYTQFAIHDWLDLAYTVLGPPKRGFTWLQI